MNPCVHGGSGDTRGGPGRDRSGWSPWGGRVLRALTADAGRRPPRGSRIPTESAVMASDRKKFRDHATVQDNLRSPHLLAGTSYAYGVLTRGSPVEDGT